MSYFGRYILNISNRKAQEVIQQLKRYIKENPQHEVWIGHRVCDNECDSNYDPTCYCDTYSIVLKDKR